MKKRPITGLKEEEGGHIKRVLSLAILGVHANTHRS